jgi:hypothetical protein
VDGSELLNKFKKNYFQILCQKHFFSKKFCQNINSTAQILSTAYVHILQLGSKFLGLQKSFPTNDQGNMLALQHQDKST